MWFLATNVNQSSCGLGMTAVHTPELFRTQDMVSVTATDTPPLFIIGCVRSGTTLVRDLLRRQPSTICPEETHYFRFGEPFRAPAYSNAILKNATLKKHREIDGISEEQFNKIITTARSKGELLLAHVNCMAQARGLDNYRWFDKTPQNVYGLPLIHAEFPEARFLHLVRNPLNVVASLKLGKVIKVEDTLAACNYWIEAVNIVRQCAPILGDKLLELRYEDITGDPVSSMRSLLEFSEIGQDMTLYSAKDAHAERNQYIDVLTDDDRRVVQDRCGKLAEKYEYKLS